MGSSISWLAFKGPSAEAGLQVLGLSKAEKMEVRHRKSVTGKSLPGGWHLVIAPGCDHPLLSDANLATLAKEGEVIACRVEEHVMFSACESWRDGTRTWRIEHDAQQGRRHLAHSGVLPEIYAGALQRANQEQDAEDAGAKEVDYFFEVPLEIAREFVGFKHDEEDQAADDAGFDIYALAPDGHSHIGRRWWQIWK